MNNNPSVLGSGPKYPFQYNDRGGLALTTMIERINQSLQILLDTPVGSRFMLPNFGSRIQDLRFEPLDNVLLSQIDHFLREDIALWERRIRVGKIGFQDSPSLRDQSTLYVTIEYMILNTSIEGNYVYPYQYGPRPISEEVTNVY